MYRKWIIIACILLLIPSITVSARVVRRGEDCIVTAEEVIDGALFAFCENLDIYGTVNGDVYGTTVFTVIHETGVINGSIYMIGGQLDVSGQINQDIHYGGAVLRLNPVEAVLAGEEDNAEVDLESLSTLTTRSIKALTLSTTLYESTVINEGILNVGYQLIMNGDSNNEVTFWGSTFEVNGRIDGNVYAIVGDPQSESSQIETLLLLIPLDLDLELLNPGLTLGEAGEVTGLLSYRGPTEGDIAGLLALPPNYTAPEVTVLTLDEPGFFNSYLEALGSEFSTLLIIGVLVLFFANNFLQAPVANLRTRPFASLGVGLLGFLLSFPIVLMILVLSLSLLGFLFVLGFRGVVIAIALVLGLVNIGGVSIFYFVAIFVTRAIVGLAIGRFTLRIIFKRQDVDDRRWLQYLALAMGVFLIATTISLPFIGIIVNAVALFLGLGAILIVVLAQFERFRESTPSTTPTWQTPSPAIIREHRIHANMEQATLPSDATQTMTAAQVNFLNVSSENGLPALPPPGSENLPDGFNWEFFDD